MKHANWEDIGNLVVIHIDDFKTVQEAIETMNPNANWNAPIGICISRDSALCQHEEARIKERMM